MPKTHHYKWFLSTFFAMHNFGFTLATIKSFNYQTEKAIRAMNDDYQKNGPAVFDYIQDQQGIIDSIDSIPESLVESTDKIHTVYHPSLMRRSAFLTIFGMIEHEVDNVCDNFSKKHKVSVKVNDLKGNGFERSNLFISRVIGLKDSQHYAQIKRIIKLRNSCAHNDAKFITPDGNEIKEITRLMNDFPKYFFKDGSSVGFHPNVLDFFTESLEAYLLEIEVALNKHQK
ncbi:hypothetical protein [Enterobacter mori]|uniref:hypothetical protein n=1 Tax=Enterobacter mori TaxID=539813 RepID=UPI000237C613|nr:hypothetical protein [Enterobacter mori]